MFRRLAAKIALCRIRDRMNDHLRPLQLGYGTESNAEAVIHVTRTLFGTTLQCKLVKIDFKNALNSHFRRQMLLGVHEHAIEL